MTGPAPGTTGATGSGPARATIRDVARDAGVSVATASRALNDTGRLRSDTRERVRAAAAALGYRPNSLARGLVGQRSFAVGLLTSDTGSRFTLPIATGFPRRWQSAAWPSSCAPAATTPNASVEGQRLLAATDGSFWAEHGVGLARRGTMARRKDPVALDVMRGIKAALDPHHILNPGKVLPAA